MLYRGAPQDLTATMADRCVLAHDDGVAHRTLLQQALQHSAVTDGVIQGKYVRLMLKAGATPSSLCDTLPLTPDNIEATAHALRMPLSTC